MVVSTVGSMHGSWVECEVHGSTLLVRAGLLDVFFPPTGKCPNNL